MLCSERRRLLPTRPLPACLGQAHDGVVDGKQAAIAASLPAQLLCAPLGSLGLGGAAQCEIHLGMRSPVLRVEVVKAPVA